MPSCKVCGVTLKRKGGKTCSKTCQYASFEGSGNPSYRNALLTGNCQVCNAVFYYYKGSKSGKYCTPECTVKSPAWKEKVRKANLGRKHTEEFREKVSRRFKNVKQSPESILKRRATVKAYYDRVGRKSKYSLLIRTSAEYAQWRKEVYERDGYSCVNCGNSYRIEVDHKVSLAFLIEEEKITGQRNYYDVDNGRTLCVPCHKKTDSYAKHLNHHLEGKLLKAMKTRYSQESDDKDFKEYYLEEMEKLINEVKQELPDL